MADKYISRIEQDSTRCWTVRIMIGKPHQIYKTFTDNKYGSKNESHFQALRFRNRMLKKHNKLIERYHLKAHPKGVAVYDKMQRFPVFRAKGYHRREVVRKNGDVYRFYYASCHDRYDGIQHSKVFPFHSHNGARGAKMAAIEWREKKVRMVQRKARKLGINP